MFLDPSSQHLNQFRQVEEIPSQFHSVLIEGSYRRCWMAPGIQVLSQQMAHPEFDLYIHHVFTRGAIELFGKTIAKKWIWIIEQDGEIAVSLASGASFGVKENEHFFVHVEEARENRFSFAQGRSIILMVSLKPTGEKMVQQFYPDLWRRLREPDAVAVHSSTYLERYYRAGLLLPEVGPILLNAFLSERVRMLLLVFNQQLIDAPIFTGLTSALERKVVLAKQLLDQYPGEAWTLKELARRTGWNIQDLKTVFKRIYMASPIEYLRSVRMQLGILLVQSTNKSIVEISGICGFKRPHHFIRALKKVTGKTPGEMRQVKSLTDNQ